eukprot:CAMPEP_0206449422 /NCGR_PEP_ID=MMETSP0324_2-20121206/18078_1 /ASSEMBLY_ACC=CAM_ASM_000836 /TAXON_ID=2866 /ORGANISM="Crypthecodinium cohnii, Strain Seligo" /LENGTH=471 /DNA_ID=CAMNT_0053918793 /DNA_START=148 /DNA_END=1563 /DNA_ORIENTATION=+
MRMSPRLRAFAEPIQGRLEEILEPSKKKLRAHDSLPESAFSDLRELLKAALPDKKAFFDDWLVALANPAVSVSSVEDIKRLDPIDIASLPVPPLVKSVFRDVLAREVMKDHEQIKVLQDTTERAKKFLAKQRDRRMQPSLAGSKYFQDQKNYKLILTSEELLAGVRIVAKRVETWSKGERVVLVGILKGAFMFMSDLCRELDRPYSVYFVEASSYLDSRVQGGDVQISAELASAKFCDATTKRPHKIVLIDELLDNGKTMMDMKQFFLRSLSATHSEDDILTVCLMSKQRSRDCPEADITGIPNLPDLWLVGYGLDDRGTKRGWTELMAIPKVKIVETIEQNEVEKLLDSIDDNAVLKKPTVFSGFELTCNPKMKYRICGFDVLTGVSKICLSHPQNMKKADLLKSLEKLHIVRGKYEHELQFAFIQEGRELVPEDSIFSGDTQVYAEMRCRLRKALKKDAKRFNVKGLDA